MKRVWKKFWKRRQLERDLDDELSFHRAMQAATEPDARAARRQFGNPTSIRETCRELWMFAALESWWQDLRYGIRSLAASPGFTIVAVMTLALGIGANATMFTIMYGAFSWNLGLDHPEKMVVVNTVDRAHGRQFGGSYPDYLDLRARTKSLAGLAAYDFFPVNVSGGSGFPERLYCVRMTANGFAVAGLTPLIGRDFSPDDERPGATPVLLLSHHVWAERYAGNPAVLGTTVRVHEVPMTVIGVMPPGRQFPEETDLWTALVPDTVLQRRDNRFLMLFGRLAEGRTAAAARGELQGLFTRLAAAYPETNRALNAEVLPFSVITGAYATRPILAALWVAVGFVLLIACVDVANMLLARGARRAREITVRVAIGAGRARIVRQLLVESFVLAAGGGLAGWGVAVAGLHWFDRATASATKPPWLHLSLNHTAFLYLAAVTLGTGFLFGLAPALRLSQIDVHSVLKDGGYGAAGSRRGLRLSRFLVAAEMALCVILLSAAGLSIRVASKLYAEPIGVNPEGVLTMHINLPEARYPRPGDLTAVQAALRERLEAVPGVERADVVSNLPLGGWLTYSYELEGASIGPAAPRIGVVVAGTHYFEVMRAQSGRGRAFRESDGVSSSPVAIVNQSFAARFWPGEEPLGKRLRLSSNATRQPWLTVVGVAPDILQNARNPLQHDPLIYLPNTEEPQRMTFLVARARVPPATLADAFRKEIQRVDQNLPIYDVRTLENHLARNRMTAGVFGGVMTVFASVALILATIGLYAVMAHAVSQRTQEIGVRMAMGGRTRDILRLVMAHGMKPLAVGLSIGLPLAFLVARVLRGVLIGISPADPAVLAGVVLILGTAGALGCAMPARRAIRVDPAVTLRQD